MKQRLLESGALALLLMAASCGPPKKPQPTPEQLHALAAKKVETDARSMLSDVMLDPTAILLRKLERGSDESGRPAICGEVNGKNRYGGFVGFQPFVAFKDGSGKVTAYMDSASGEESPTPNQRAEAYLYHQTYAKYCAPAPAKPSARAAEPPPSPTQSSAALTSNTTAESGVIPVIIAGDYKGRAGSGCDDQVVGGLDPNGDNFLSVHVRPDIHSHDVARLHEGQALKVCQSHGRWLGVIWSSVDDIEACETKSLANLDRPYKGPCRSGWVAREYVMYEDI